MTPLTAAHGWQRRARPLLGTLVDVGLRSAPGEGNAAFEAAFAAVFAVQRCLSRFDPGSDLSRFHALGAGQAVPMRPPTQAVLAAAAALQRASGGDFDISLGSAPRGWRCEGALLRKLRAGTRLDTGGIAKGYAVDLAVQALVAHGCAAGWVNAGGDLRAFGDLELPVDLRNETTGGVTRFALLRDGAFASSHFDAGSRSRLATRRAPSAPHATGSPAPRAHVSVAAPQCLWADALTKIVALRGDPADPLLARYEARAWRH